MISFLKNNKKSTMTRCILDGLPIPIALFNLKNELVFVNFTFQSWFMYQSPGIIKLSEIMKRIDSLMSNELNSILIDISHNENLDWIKEVTVRTSIKKHRNLKVTLKRLHSEDFTEGVLMFFENKHRTEDNLEIYKKQAHVDQLTGVLNRFGFYEAFNAIEHKVVNDNLIYAVLIADIDGLKAINDLHGHSYGDKVITMTAKSLSLSLRDEDILCRWGGDEFIIILANMYSTNHLNKVLDRVLDRIESLTTTQNPPIKLSLGSAICHVNGDNLTELIDYADKAMYVDKRYRY